jgi:hypothetical protein
MLDFSCPCGLMVRFQLHTPRTVCLTTFPPSKKNPMGVLADNYCVNIGKHFLAKISGMGCVFSVRGSC